MTPKTQAAILESLDADRAADIVEEMAPDEAADVLAEMEEETSEAILDEMEAEEKTDVEELLEFDEDSAGGLMNSEFIAVPDTGHRRRRDAGRSARTRSRSTRSPPCSWSTRDGRLTGALPVGAPVPGGPDARSSSRWPARTRSCPCPSRSAASASSELVDKYNLMTLPVVDETGVLVGVDHGRRRHLRCCGRTRPVRLIERLPRPLLIFFTVIGPGFITAMVDNDAGGIYTYSQAGALFGYMLLWTLPPIALLLVVTQEMNARMGAVTGKGLSDLIREEFGLRTTFVVMALLVLANFTNVMANFAGVASALELFHVQQVHLGAAGGRGGLVPRREGHLPQRREDLPRSPASPTSPTSSRRC